MAIIDIVLLFIMLVGLHRMRPDSGGTFGLTQFVWKQVLWQFSLTMAISVH